MGKGGGNSVIPTYAGMKYDIEMLLSRFKDNGSPRFTVFRQLFQQQQFGRIFAGRLAPAELVEFSERLLQMTAEYMHSNKVPAQPVYLHGAIPMGNVEEPSRSLLERLFGVYLTYSLFFLQPSNYVSQVRVTPVQMDDCRGLLDKLIEDNHLDAVACLMKLIAYRAFHVVAFSGSFDPTSHRRYEMAQEDDDNIADCVEPPFSDVKAFMSDPLVKQLELLSQTTPKCSFEKQIMKIREIAENSQCSTAAGGTIDIGPSTSGSGSDRKGIKDRHYTGIIKHNRNRRYADPNLVVGSGLDETDEMSTDPAPSKTPSSAKGKKKCGRPKLSRDSETIDNGTFISEPRNKRGRRSSTGNINGSPELAATVDLFASLDESNKNKNVVKMTPKRPIVNDAKFHAKIKSVSARSKKQKENDLLLEDLMKDS